MEIIFKILIGVIAILHLFFFWMESIVWTTFGRKIFGGKKEFFESTKSLAANQGLYNGFLAAGLIWSLLTKNPTVSNSVSIFFLACVAIAGIFGAVTVSKKIFWIQAFPAILALILFLVK
ncbi:DUF1304 domain-containing protein [Algoriphagus kandeliae]|uniref:DUF1304 domain-containing protein n=1 Tax=Algoriphagus kandeliae TaxID=2562278 RepID=A0A4Y9QWZ3_9BACT|nr:DUF1304 domain-containing protein [Algoriphagus kandeliae]TFV95733.1 DUF1304 domain-containing protein [Algoriphagus kandeliae]